MKTTLNIGCGNKTFEEYPVGHKCINLDNRTDLENIDVIGDVRKLNFSDNSFDYILASDIIEHFPIKDTKNLLLEWKRVLKSGGVLEIRTPNLKILTHVYVKGVGDNAHQHPTDFFSYHVFGGQDYPGNFHYVIFDRSWLSLICKECGLKETDYEEVVQNFTMKVKKEKRIEMKKELTTNIILRPVYNRPEMLELSLQYEAEARECYGKTDHLTTLFIVEYGSPKKTLELIDKYPYKKKIEFRKRKMGLTINILEGMKQAFDMTRSFIVYIEDDILLHKTYFQYMKALFEMDLGELSVLSAYNPDDGGDVHAVRKHQHYAALAPLITKSFFDRYVRKYVSIEYYGGYPDEGRNFQCRHNFVMRLNERYKKYQASRRYKYKDGTHNEQAGLLNRLIDVAMIEEDMSVIMPSVNRQIHIGFYGKNRPGGKIPGSTYEKRVENLRAIVQDGSKMYALTKSKQYDDYKSFSSKLDDWDGTLRLK